MKTKFLNSILLAVASLALFIPTQVWAQNYDKVDFVVDGIAYSFLSDGTVSVVPIERFSLSNYEELDKADLVIPGYVTYRGQQYRVSRIGALSFKQNSEMFGLYLDDSESIGISKVTIPATVDVVEKDAFSNPNKLNTNLHTVVIEGPNTEIQSGAFSDNPNLTEVIAPNTFSPMGFNGTPWYNLWYDSQPDGVLYYGTQAVGYKGDAPADSTIVLRPGTTAIG